jgi:hypothetical protein
VPRVYAIAQDAEQIGLRSRELFLTRPKGAQAYPLLADELRETADGDALIIDFPANQLVDGSFADETVVELGEAILRGEFGAKCMLLRGLTEDSMKNINAVISLRRSKLPLLAVEASGHWQVLGRLEDHLAETLRLVAEHSALTAGRLTTILGVEINTASTRLKRLHNLHLVRREHEITERGLQYLYYFWEWSEHRPG